MSAHEAPQAAHGLLEQWDDCRPHQGWRWSAAPPAAGLVAERSPHHRPYAPPRRLAAATLSWRSERHAVSPAHGAVSLKRSGLGPPGTHMTALKRTPRYLTLAAAYAA